MSMTFNLTVSTDVRLVVGDSDLQAFREARAASKAVAATPGFKPKGLRDQTPQGQYVAQRMLSDEPEESLLKFLITHVAKEHLRDSVMEFAKDNCTDKKSARVAPIRVKFNENKKANCQGCVETNCVKSERNTNSGCEGKRIGVRVVEV